MSDEPIHLEKIGRWISLLIEDALDKTCRLDFSVFVNRKRLAYFGLLGVGAFLALSLRSIACTYQQRADCPVH